MSLTSVVCSQNRTELCIFDFPRSYINLLDTLKSARALSIKNWFTKTQQIRHMASTFIMQLKKEGSLQVIILLQHILYICTLHEGETLMQEGEIQSKHEGTQRL